MTFAIIGSGAIGTAIARSFVRNDVSVMIANKTGKASLSALVEELGPNIVPSDLPAALSADIVILAVPFDSAAQVLRGVADWGGRIIVDATNAINLGDFSPADLGGRPSTDVIADAAPGARLVKAFNHNFARVLARDPSDGKGGRHVLFVSGNDTSANTAVITWLTSFGFEAIDLGRTDAGGLLQQFGGALTTRSFVSQAQSGASPPEMDLLVPHDTAV